MKLNYIKTFNYEKIIFFWSISVIVYLQTKNNLTKIYLPFLILFLVMIYLIFRDKNILKYINLINLSFIYITFNEIGSVFAGNNLNYLPSILKDSVGIFKYDFTANTTYPYPAFKFLLEIIIDWFGLNVLIYLNFFSGMFVFITFGLVNIYLFKTGYQLLNIIFLFILTPGLFQYVFIELLNLDIIISLLTSDSVWPYKHTYLKINDYISGGFSHFTFVTNNFEPSMFDALLLLSVILFSKKKFLLSFFLASLSLLMHTYNIVPVTVLIIIYFYNHRDYGDKKFFTNLIPLIISYLFVVSYSLFYLNSPNEFVTMADQIMTNQRIPNHKLFNGTLTLFSLFSFDLNNFSFKTGGAYPGRNGFPFELEILIFYYLLKKLANKELKYFFDINFYIIIFSIVFSYYNPENLLGAYLRTFTPWRLSLFFYFFGTVYLLNHLLNKYLIFKKPLIILTLFLVSIYSYIEFDDRNVVEKNLKYQINEPFYRINNFLPFNENSKYINLELNNIIKPAFDDNQQYLSSFGDQNVMFSSFLSTSGNYISHPYKATEIVEWWEKKIEVDKIFKKYHNNTNCSDIFFMASRFGYKKIIFTENNPLSHILFNCDTTDLENKNDYFLISVVNSK